MQAKWIRLVYSQYGEKWEKGKTEILGEELWVGWTGAWAEFFWEGKWLGGGLGRRI